MTAESLLGDLGRFASFKHDASELKEELREYQQDHGHVICYLLLMIPTSQ